jgi:AraC-like DNA-binding protein
MQTDVSLAPTRPQPAGTAPRWQPSTAWATHSFSPNKVAAIVDVGARFGVPAARLLAGTSLKVEQLSDPDTLTSTAQLYRVVQNAVQHCPLPDLGWLIGQRLRVTSYGMYGYALLCAPDMRTGLDLATRYHILANALVPISHRVTDDTMAWVFPSRAQMTLPDLDETIYRVLIEMQMAVHYTLTRDVLGDQCVPLRALLTWPAGQGPKTALAKTCACLYNLRQPELHYARHWLDRAPQLANAVTAAQASRACAQLAQARAHAQSITQRVCQELMKTPGQFPGIETVASSMCMTGRTLRRHLQSEGARYADLFARVRQALAEDYLRSTRMSVEDIASALSFGNARSFRQAFARWTGVTPSDFRRGQ